MLARVASARGFWGLALVADTYERSGHRGENPALDAWLDVHRVVASVTDNVPGPFLVLPRGDANPMMADGDGWLIAPPEWQSPFGNVTYVGPPPKKKRRCCPKSITFDVTEDLDDPCKPGFAMEVTAEWLSAPDPCDCNCCEVRQFIRSVDKAVATGVTFSPEDFQVPPYHMVPHATMDRLYKSTDPWAVYEVSGEHFVEDAAFALKYDDAGHVIEYGSAIDMNMQSQLIDGGRKKWGPRMRRFGVDLPARKSECGYQYVDKPSIECKGGKSREGMWIILVVIRPKPGEDCDGEVMHRLCVLRAACTVVGHAHGARKVVRENGVERHEKSECVAEAEIGPGCARS